MGVPTERYSRITEKNQREICLLQGFPCAWGKCVFCDYIEDNSRDEKAMIALNRKVLSRVTGGLKALEIINSGSCFELPGQTLEDIVHVIKNKKIEKLFFEAHWMYRGYLKEMRKKIPVPVTFKIGVETFDNDFRQKILCKNAGFSTPQEVAEYFDSPCLMVGIKGQTKEMIAYDIDCLKKYFSLGTVNIYNNNTTSVKRDEALVQWFMKEYQWLLADPAVEVLYEITDFGVG
ncbi:radical SAM protein [Lachnospiraceae bacterium 62-35]